jgi:serine/threonine protein kinase
MGEVYRARDPRLGREVAIKVLPAAFSDDPDRLRRFEQEARAAAALNHPNILTVHKIGTHEGQPYVVSELLDGQTLRDTIPRDGMPVKRALDAAIQICRGLAAAHEKGIVHRDLKPENVFVTTDGRIKILDFGLAKLTEAGAMAAGATMEMTRTANTSAGLVLGTVGYMSPEQARGLPIDHRSDLFNVGSTLYEMLSGARAFSGPTTADTISAILGSDPADLTNAPRNIAPGLDRIVRHCLEKSPAQRFQSASDVAFALEALTVTPSGMTAVAHVSDRRVRCRTIAIKVCGRAPRASRTPISCVRRDTDVANTPAMPMPASSSASSANAPTSSVLNLGVAADVRTTSAIVWTPAVRDRSRALPCGSSTPSRMVRAAF